MLRLSTTKKEIVSLYGKELLDVSDEAFKDLSTKEKKSRLKANAKAEKRLTQELKLQAAIHKMAARVVIQYSISIDEALSLAETEIREEVELSRQKKLKQKKERIDLAQPCAPPSISLSLEEEIEQYAHNLEETEFVDYKNALIIAKREVPFAREEKEKRIDTKNSNASTDQLFATLFNRDSGDRVHESGEVQGQGGKEGGEGDDDNQEQRKEKIKPSSVEQLDSNVPIVNQNKRFQQAVKKVIDTNKAKRQAFKSLGESAMSKTLPIAALSIHSKKEDDNAEQKQKKEKVEPSSVEQSHQLEPKKVNKNKRLQQTVKKVIDTNKAKKQAVKSLPVGVLSMHCKEEDDEEERRKEGNESSMSHAHSSASISTNPGPEVNVKAEAKAKASVKAKAKASDSTSDSTRSKPSANVSVELSGRDEPEVQIAKAKEEKVTPTSEVPPHVPNKRFFTAVKKVMVINKLDDDKNIFVATLNSKEGTASRPPTSTSSTKNTSSLPVASSNKQLTRAMTTPATGRHVMISYSSTRYMHTHVSCCFLLATPPTALYLQYIYIILVILQKQIV